MKFYRSAEIYQRQDGFYLHPWSFTTDGVRTLDVPILFVPLSATDRELGDAVLTAFQHVRKNLPHPKVFDNSQTQLLLDAAKVKTLSAFVKNTRAISVSEWNGGMEYLPLQNNGGRRWFDLLNDLLFISPDTSPEAIGMNVRKAIELAL